MTSEMAEKCAQAQELKDNERRVGMTGRGMIGAHKQTSGEKSDSTKKASIAAATTARQILVYLWPISDNRRSTKDKLGFANRDFPETMLFYGMSDYRCFLLTQIHSTYTDSFEQMLLTNSQRF